MTQKEIRINFWGWLQETNPEIYQKGKKSKTQNEQVIDVRIAFTDYIEHLSRNGSISENLARKVTL